MSIKTNHSQTNTTNKNSKEEQTMNNIDNNLRLFARGKTVSNNSYATGLNNNDLIIGPSGGGKTTGYVIPNINQHYGSYIVADTKGNLCKKLSPSLKASGYKVMTLDLVNPEYSCGYNPLDFIRRTKNGYSQNDVIRIASILSPVGRSKDPFWEESAQSLLSALIAYVVEAFPRNKQNLVSVNKLFKMMRNPNFGKLFDELEIENPNSFAVEKYRSVSMGTKAETTWSCILQFISRSLRTFDLPTIEDMSTNGNKVDFRQISSEPTVLFVNVSDTERSMDPLANVFYTQMFQQLCNIADSNKNSRLDIPVRIILDDFATNVFIPDFDKIISVIRSREISASLIIQSISQLTSLYGESAALTIINNCDHTLYLGGQDLGTADLIASRVNKSRETILSMSREKAYFIERGGECELVDKILPEDFATAFDNSDNSSIGASDTDISDKLSQDFSDNFYDYMSDYDDFPF